jgi:DNA-binding NarL/FixJ family response regulator
MPTTPNGTAESPAVVAENSVLVVEDEFLVADYICSVLEDAGYPVVGTAANAAEALALIAASRPALALLDIRLAGGDDGVILAGALRSALPNLAVVFVTGSGDPETRQRAAAVTPSAFLQKPVSPETLLHTVRSVLAS